MKKLIIMAAIVCAAIVSQAAAFSWDGFDIKDVNGDNFSGTATLYCVELTSLTATGTVDGGDLMGTALVSDDFVADTMYHFYFTAQDTLGNTFKSEVAEAKALAVGTGSISFDGSGNWTAVPEPTSALLLVLGVAGLALKRKRA